MNKSIHQVFFKFNLISTFKILYSLSVVPKVGGVLPWGTLIYCRGDAEPIHYILNNGCCCCFCATVEKIHRFVIFFPVSDEHNIF